MGRSCSSRCTKAFLVFFNLLFLICGGFFLGIGIWMQIDRDMVVYVHIIKDTASGPFFDNIPYILIGIGAFVSLLSFLGCCGACAESVCFLCMYTLLLFGVLATEITAAVLVSVYKDKLGIDLEDAMERQIRYNYTVKLEGQNKTNPISTSWNFMQVELSCCGSRGPGDYMHSLWYNQTKENEKGVFVPATCCVLSNKGHDMDFLYPQPLESDLCQTQAILVANSGKDRFKEDFTASQFIHPDGCHGAFVDWVEENMVYIIVAVVGIVILQILDIIAACVLMSRIRREQSKYPCGSNKEKGTSPEKRGMLGKKKRKV